MSSSSKHSVPCLENGSFFSCTPSTLLFLSEKTLGLHSQINKLHHPNFSKFLVLSFPPCLGSRTGCFSQQGSCCGCSTVARAGAVKVQNSLPRGNVAVSRPSSVSLAVSQFLPPDSQPSLQSHSHPLISER